MPLKAAFMIPVSGVCLPKSFVFCATEKKYTSLPISLAHYCVKLQVESETEVIIRKERGKGFHLLSEFF